LLLHFTVTQNSIHFSTPVRGTRFEDFRKKTHGRHQSASAFACMLYLSSAAPTPFGRQLWQRVGDKIERMGVGLTSPLFLKVCLEFDLHVAASQRDPSDLRYSAACLLAYLSARFLACWMVCLHACALGAASLGVPHVKGSEKPPKSSSHFLGQFSAIII
jgi:hypothetical protein